MKYILNITEEGVKNPDYKGCRGGRIEVINPDQPYNVAEIRLLLPAEAFQKVRDAIDGLEVSKFQIGEVSNFSVESHERHVDTNKNR